MQLKKYRLLLILGSILIAICLFYYRYKIINYIIDYKKEIIVQNYLNNKNSPLIGVLEIPKINLKKGLYSFDSKDNQVNKNIEVLKESNLPYDIILAAHSGSGRTSYFKDIFKLEKNDVIYFYYENKKYTFGVVRTYKVLKTNYLSLNNSNNRLVLTTCDEEDDNMQYVVIANLLY